MATAHESYEFVSLGPAASGWRAVLSGEDGGTQLPLVAWGIFHKTRRQATGEVIEDLGNVMEGVIAHHDPTTADPAHGGSVKGFSCAAGQPGFEAYLPPGT